MRHFDNIDSGREHPQELDYQTGARDFKTRLAELLNTWQGHVGHAGL